MYLKNEGNSTSVPGPASLAACLPVPRRAASGTPLRNVPSPWTPLWWLDTSVAEGSIVGARIDAKRRDARPRTDAVCVDDRDAAWLSDWGANAIVRFDPATERFEVFPGSQANAHVRQLLGRPGEVWAPESGSDRLVVFRTR